MPGSIPARRSCGRIPVAAENHRAEADEYRSEGETDSGFGGFSIHGRELERYDRIDDPPKDDAVEAERDQERDASQEGSHAPEYTRSA